MERLEGGGKLLETARALGAPNGIGALAGRVQEHAEHAFPAWARRRSRRRVTDSVTVCLSSRAHFKAVAPRLIL